MSKQPNYVFDDELYHHGIKGQRWGDRRFQNEDGSWTPEGRERYGKGGRLFQFLRRKKSEQQLKADEQKAKAKISYNTQKYKADLKSKAQKEKDKRAAEEDRNRLKQQSKTEKMLKKEQGKIDREAKKEQAKTEKQGRPLGMKMTRTKNMSDEDLQKAVDRLKLQAEYNKQYALATQPNSALAKADRFFSGPTGQVVKEVAVATLPKVAEQFTKVATTSAFKYYNKEDRDKAAADIEKSKADAEKVRADTRYRDAETAEKQQTIATAKAKSESELKDAERKRKIELTNAKNDVEKMRYEELRTQDAHNRQQQRLDNESQAKIQRENAKSEMENKKQAQALEIERAEKFGGIEYELQNGRKVKTTGSIALKDKKERLDSIYYQKEKEKGEQVYNAIANAQILNVKTDSIYRQQNYEAELNIKKQQAEFVAAQTAQIKATTAQQKASANLANQQAQSLAYERRQQQEANYKSQLRSLEAQGYTQEEMANRFGVSIYTIRKLLG